MFEQKKSYLYIFLLALAFLGIATDVKSSENFIDFKERREAALHQIKIGNTKVGLIKLVKLSDKGDGVSSHTLGLFYLRAHHIVRPNIDKAVQLFGLGASQCYAPSLNVLKKNFWGNKTSKYFDLKKINLAEMKCEKTRLENFEEQRKAEAKSKKEAEAEEQRKAEAKSKKEAEAEEQRKAEAKGTNLINADIVFAWSNILPKFSTPLSGGSGFAISDNGYFLTNHHVAFSENCNHIAVSYNSLEGVGKPISFNEELDLALIKVNAPTPYFAKFDYTEPKAGERLVALGYPVTSIFGNSPTITEGTLVNASDKQTTFRADGFLMISVPITQGNSGGPIFSRNSGIRGIAAYGYSRDFVEDYLKEQGQNVNLDAVNLNFMVSGIRAFDWITKNANFSSPEKVPFAASRQDTEDVADFGLKTLASITCYED